MTWRNVLLRNSRGEKRGSIMIVAVVLMVVAGFSTLSWTAYITQAQFAGVRARDRMVAFYAAESGVERVIDFFNNPANFPDGATPAEYTSEMAASPYLIYSRAFPAGLDMMPDGFPLFEPYWRRVEVDNQGYPVDVTGTRVTDDDGNLLDLDVPPLINMSSYLNAAQVSKIPTCTLDVDSLTNMIISADGRELARITQIQLINPVDFPMFGDPVPDPNLRVVTKVVATAETPRGIRMQVETVLRENPLVDLRAPGALISWASATFDGQFNVNWGEVWAQGNVPLKNSWNGNNGIPNEVDDPWFKLRSQGELLNSSSSQFANGAVSGAFSGTSIASGAANYYQPFRSDVLHANNQSGNNDCRLYENLYQNDDLLMPDYDYAVMKEFFLVNDLPYYWTGANGTIYGRDRDPNSGTYGQVVGKAYDGWFHTDPSSSEYWETYKRLAFVDTIPTDANGNPGPSENGVPVINATYKPRPPSGSNMAEISSQGTGIHTRGAIFVSGHFRHAGSGNPPADDDIVEPYELDGSGGGPYVTDPLGGTASGNVRVNHNGLLYCYGQIRGTGNYTVYGSLFAKMGFSGAGAREIYYNYRLRDGSWLDINQSRVRRLMWNVSTPDPISPNS